MRFSEIHKMNECCDGGESKSSIHWYIASNVNDQIKNNEKL